MNFVVKLTCVMNAAGTQVPKWRMMPKATARLGLERMVDWAKLKQMVARL